MEAFNGKSADLAVPRRWVQAQVVDMDAFTAGGDPSGDSGSARRSCNRTLASYVEVTAGAHRTTYPVGGGGRKRESDSLNWVKSLIAPGLVLLQVGLLAACGGDAGSPAARPAAPAVPAGEGGLATTESDSIFVDGAADHGLDFVHFNGMWGDLLLQEITCGAGALLDYDGDGDLDAYLLQGHMVGPGKTLEDATVPPRHPPPLTDRLYRNDLGVGDGGGARSASSTLPTPSGGAPTGYGCGVAVGDYDRDGWPDLYVANVGANQLLRNQGDGTFRDVTAAAGVGR